MPDKPKRKRGRPRGSGRPLGMRSYVIARLYSRTHWRLLRIREWRRQDSIQVLDDLVSAEWAKYRNSIKSIRRRMALDNADDKHMEVDGADDRAEG